MFPKNLLSTSFRSCLRPNNRFFFSNLKLQIKTLREVTGAPLLKCKNALEQFDGNLEQAKQFLYEKNLATAEKKSERETSVGVISYNTNYVDFVGMAEIACETDFVLKNENFQDFAEKIGSLLPEMESNVYLDKSASEDVLKNNYNDIWIENQHLIAKIQENIRINKIQTIKDPQSNVVGVYMHKTYRPQVGKTLTYIMLSHSKQDQLTEKEDAILKEVAEDLAIHIFCKKPEYIDEHDVPEQLMNEFKQTVMNDIDEKILSKPEEIVNKVISGKMSKLIDDKLFMRQEFGDSDDNEKVADLLASLQKTLGFEIKVNKFASIQI
jgi:elongation factor Ts